MVQGLLPSKCCAKVGCCTCADPHKYSEGPPNQQSKILNISEKDTEINTVLILINSYIQ